MTARTIEERVAVLEQIAEHQNEALDSIAMDVKQLTAMANRGKGAIAILIGVGGVLGTVGTLVAEKIFGGS